MFEKMEKAWKASEGPKAGVPGTEAELAPIEAAMAHSMTPEGSSELSAEMRKKEAAIDAMMAGVRALDGLLQDRILSGVTDKAEQDQIMAEQKALNEALDKITDLEETIGLAKKRTVR